MLYDFSGINNNKELRMLVLVLKFWKEVVVIYILKRCRVKRKHIKFFITKVNCF